MSRKRIFGPIVDGMRSEGTRDSTVEGAMLLFATCFCWWVGDASLSWRLAERVPGAGHKADLLADGDMCQNSGYPTFRFAVVLAVYINKSFRSCSTHGIASELLRGSWQGQ